MPHHGSKVDDLLNNEMAKILEEEAKERKMGPTGKFPKGKLIDSDEGEIGFGVTHMNGKVVINFGSPVAWLGIDPALARELAASLIKHADEVDA